MIIEQGGKPGGNVEIGLTEREAKELIVTLEQLLVGKAGRAGHSHVSDDDYQTDVAVWIIDPDEEPYWERAR